MRRLDARLLLVPAAMALAMGSLAFTVSNGGPMLGDAADPDASQGLDSGPLDGGGFDGPSFDGSTCFDNFGQVCGMTGGLGCSGSGGFGGSGGQGGAASVGLVAIGTSTVFVTNGAFVTGHGGTGGPGGAGQSGGPGDAGIPGASVPCKGACASGCTTTTTLAGGSGGSGSSGGSGGQGGGGAGGPVYDYVEVNGGKVSIVTPGTLDASVLGTPGSGGAPNGPDGSAGVHP